MARNLLYHSYTVAGKLIVQLRQRAPRPEGAKRIVVSVYRHQTVGTWKCFAIVGCWNWMKFWLHQHHVQMFVMIIRADQCQIWLETARWVHSCTSHLALSTMHVSRDHPGLLSHADRRRVDDGVSKRHAAGFAAARRCLLFVVYISIYNLILDTISCCIEM